MTQSLPPQSSEPAPAPSAPPDQQPDTAQNPQGWQPPQPTTTAQNPQGWQPPQPTLHDSGDVGWTPSPTEPAAPAAAAPAAAPAGPGGVTLSDDQFRQLIAAFHQQGGFTPPTVGGSGAFAAPPLPTVRDQEVANAPDGQEYLTPSGAVISVQDGDDGPVTSLTTGNGTKRTVAGDVHEIAVKLAHLFDLG